jgi:hypothetical protein
MQLVICLLLHFIHIWYLGWPWSEHAHIIPISPMVDFCESWKGLKLLQKSTIGEIGIICACSDHGQPRYQIWIKCNKRQMTSCVHKMCERTYGPWSEHGHIIPISPMVNFCESYSPFHVCLTILPSLHLVYATSHLSFVTFYSYLVSWLTYGQTNMKRAKTLAKINHRWNWYNMRMLRSWPTKIPNMNKMRQKTNASVLTSCVRN